MRPLIQLGLNGTGVAIVDTTYYISTSGQFSNDGLTPETATTIDRLNSLTLTNKTHILLKKGDVFDGFGDHTWRYHFSSLGHYSTGANPKLRASVDASVFTWTNEGSNRWSTPISPSAMWPFVGDVACKWSQTAPIQITATPSSGVIRVATADLSGYASSLVGAQVQVFDQTYWNSYPYTITAYDGGTGNITLDRPIPEAVTGKYIILFGQVQFFTATNDWAYDSATQKLWLRNTSDPSSIAIRLSTKNVPFEFRAWDIDIDSVDVQHYLQNGYYGVDGMTGNITMSNCVMSNIKGRGALFVNCTNYTSTGNTAHHCGLDGIRISKINGRVQSIGDTTYTIGMDANFQLPYEITNVSRTSGTGIAVRGLPLLGDADLIERPTVYDTAWCGIVGNGVGVEITKFYVYDFMKRFRDGSGVYTSGTATGSSFATYIHHGIIRNGATTAENTTLVGVDSPPEGVYVDWFTNGARIEYVFCYAIPGAGCRINFGTSGTVFKNNVMGRCASKPLIIVNTAVTIDMQDNVLIAVGAASYCVEITGGTPFTTSNNNRYINPYTVNIALSGANQDTLAEHQTRYSKDAGSTEMTNYITYTSAANAAIEVMAEWNPTDTPVDFAVPAGYKQIDGTSGGTISVPAWGGAFYLKETAA